jgi:hypothetical protein
MAMVAAIALLATCRAPQKPAGPFVQYSVSSQTVTVVAAVTPYDDNPKAREAFLHWFKRGFEVGFAGKAPPMIEWNDTLEAKAGRRGYDFGIEEGERCRGMQKTPNQQSMRTTPIPPDGI